MVPTGPNTWDIVNDEPCDWFGVTVVNGNVERLALTNNSLSGTLSNSIADLVNLTNLSLGNNTITGSIPSTIGSLINLRILQLNSNELSGSIPTAIGKSFQFGETGFVVQ